MALVGSLHLWLVSSVPTGYLVCDGTAISRTTYADLFAVLGTMYGVGDGSTTFNLPDYRGYFPRIRDNLAGVDPDAATRAARPDGVGGDVVGTTQTSALKSHRHSTGSNVGTSGASGPHAQTTSNTSGTALNRNTVNTGGIETRPVNINFIPLIKY